MAFKKIDNSLHNPLLLHIDTGWNNKTAVSNIENLVDKLELDLHTIVIDWNEMKDLTLSFFRSQVPTIDTVQDHAIWAGMYNFARDNNIKNILTTIRNDQNKINITFRKINFANTWIDFFCLI